MRYNDKANKIIKKNIEIKSGFHCLIQNIHNFLLLCLVNKNLLLDIRCDIRYKQKKINKISYSSYWSSFQCNFTIIWGSLLTTRANLPHHLRPLFALHSTRNTLGLCMINDRSQLSLVIIKSHV